MTAATVATASVGVVVITHRARDRIADCLAPLQASPLRPRILVVNSSSCDGTVEAAEELGTDTMTVPRWRFNHGLTRELARHRIGTPVVVMLTPDAVATGPEFLERLTAPLRCGEAAVAYARQVAGPECGLLERAGRVFSYPELGHLRSRADRSRFGSYLHFCSNAAAAWSSAALDRIGGFKPTLVSEETVAAAELLAAGEKIAYVADAVVCHAHRLGPVAAFRRQFDIGYSRRQHAALLLSGEGDLRRGRRFARTVVARAVREAPAELPRILAVLGASWAGYRTGLLGPHLPVAIARRVSGQDYYWSSDLAPGGGRAWMAG